MHSPVLEKFCRPLKKLIARIQAKIETLLSSIFLIYSCEMTQIIFPVCILNVLLTSNVRIIYANNKITLNVHSGTG